MIKMQGAPEAAGLRNAAAQVRARSERVSAVRARLDSQVGSMAYAGPAADQFRSVMATEQWGVGEVARIMSELVDILNRAAAQVEADPLTFDQAWRGGTA